MGSNTRSGLHYDYVDNFFVQVHGRKDVVLAAPEEARNLHVFSDCHTKSRVAPKHPDLAKFPAVKRWFDMCWARPAAQLARKMREG